MTAVADARALRTVLLTGDARRHRAAAHWLAAGTQLVGVVAEPKRPVVAAPERLPDAERMVLDRHLSEREAAERRALASCDAWPDADVLPIEAGTLNAPAVVAWIADRRPDVVVSFGCGILRAPLLDAFDGRLVNVHLGLSPYYRGSATNFWALVHREPECVGATIHVTTAALDGGPVLAQVRPLPAPVDDAHTLGVKTVAAAFQALPRTLAAYVRGRLSPQAQPTGVGRVCRRADFGAAAVERLWDNLQSGMLPEYLADADRRRAAYPIVEVSA
ncbi:MAG: formyl transferase [Gemmatirosa sp.]